MTAQSECTICLLDYNEETKTETECNHIFHQECLDKWLQTNYTCPLCRTELKKDTLCRPIYALPSEQHYRYNSSRIDPVTLDLGIGLEAVMTETGFNVEDGIVFGRELIDEGLTMRPFQRMTMDLIRGHDEMRPRSLHPNSIVSSEAIISHGGEEIEYIDYNSANTDDDEEMYSPYSLGGDLYDEEAYMREVSLYM